MADEEADFLDLRPKVTQPRRAIMNTSTSEGIQKNEKWLEQVTDVIRKTPGTEALGAIIKEYEDRLQMAEHSMRDRLLEDAQILSLREALTRETTRRIELEKALSHLTHKFNTEHYYGMEKIEITDFSKLQAAVKAPNKSLTQLKKKGSQNELAEETDPDGFEALQSSSAKSVKRLFAAMSLLENKLEAQMNTVKEQSLKVIDLEKQLSDERTKSRILEAETKSLRFDIERAAVKFANCQKEVEEKLGKEVTILKNSLQKKRDEVSSLKKQLLNRTSDLENINGLTNNQINILEARIKLMDEELQSKTGQIKEQLTIEQNKFSTLRTALLTYLSSLCVTMSSNMVKYDASIKCTELQSLENMGEQEIARLFDALMHVTTLMTCNQNQFLTASPYMGEANNEKQEEDAKEIKIADEFVYMNYDEKFLSLPYGHPDRKTLSTLKESSEALRLQVDELNEVMASFENARTRPLIVGMKPALEKAARAERIAQDKFRLHRGAVLADFSHSLQSIGAVIRGEAPPVRRPQMIKIHREVQTPNQKHESPRASPRMEGLQSPSSPTRRQTVGYLLSRDPEKDKLPPIKTSQPIAPKGTTLTNEQHARIDQSLQNVFSTLKKQSSVVKQIKLSSLGSENWSMFSNQVKTTPFQPYAVGNEGQPNQKTD